MIDFHCHLDLYPAPFEVAQACAEKGIYVLSVTTTPSAWEGTIRLEGSGSRIRTALGLHPQLVHLRKSEVHLFERLLPLTQYVGEIGLDGSPEYRHSWEDQCLIFDQLLKLCAREGGRVMSIHSRRATAPVLDALLRHQDAGIPIMHWFSGTQRELERAISIGCWFSVGPAMFSSEKARRLIAKMPRDRILTESDGPFAQLNGTAVMPWDVSIAVRELGLIWNVEQSEVEVNLLDNLRQLVSHSNGGGGRSRTKA